VYSLSPSSQPSWWAPGAPPAASPQPGVVVAPQANLAGRPPDAPEPPRPGVPPDLPEVAPVPGLRQALQTQSPEHGGEDARLEPVPDELDEAARVVLARAALVRSAQSRQALLARVAVVRPPQRAHHVLLDALQDPLDLGWTSRPPPLLADSLQGSRCPVKMTSDYWKKTSSSKCAKGASGH